MDLGDGLKADFPGQWDAIMKADKEERLQKDRDRPMPPPFKRSFPIELLTKIIAEVDFFTIPTCLRVSKQFFHIAGKRLYTDIEVDEMQDHEAMMMEAEITISRTKKGAEGEGKSEGKEATPAPTTNFKRQLLKYVQTIVVRAHHCPKEKAKQTTLTKAARMMTGLKRIILVPEADFMSTAPLCEKESGCPLVAGLKSKHLTLHNLQVDGPDAGPLELFTTVLNKVQHVTLIIPPTSFYIGGRGGMFNHISGRPGDLAYPTRHCESVRLIVGISEAEIMMLEYDHPVSLTKIGPLQEFLAAFINLNFTKIEIYIFNNFDNTLDLPTFRQELATKVIKHYEDSIKYLTESKRLEPKHSNWSANYQVFGLEDYFATPKLHYEIDDHWMMEWEQELHERQRANCGARKKAREELLGQLEAEMSDYGSDGEEVPVNDESMAVAANPEGSKEQNKVGGEGEDGEEGRPIKKAKV